MEHHRKHHLLTQEEIAHVAYEMYLIEGKPEGRHIEHWLEAERVLLERHSQQEEAKKPTPATSRNLKPVIKATRSTSSSRTSK